MRGTSCRTRFLCMVWFIRILASACLWKWGIAIGVRWCVDGASIAALFVCVGGWFDESGGAVSRAVPSFELTPATIEVDSVREVEWMEPVYGVEGRSIESGCLLQTCWCVGFFWEEEGEWVWQVVNWEISLLNAERGFYGLNTRSWELWRSDTDMVFHFHSFLRWMRGWLCRVGRIRIMIIMLKEWNVHMAWRSSSESLGVFIDYIERIESDIFKISSPPIFTP